MRSLSCFLLGPLFEVHEETKDGTRLQYVYEKRGVNGTVKKVEGRVIVGQLITF